MQSHAPIKVLSLVRPMAATLLYSTLPNQASIARDEASSEGIKCVRYGYSVRYNRSVYFVHDEVLDHLA